MEGLTRRQQVRRARTKVEKLVGGDWNDRWYHAVLALEDWRKEVEKDREQNSDEDRTNKQREEHMLIERVEGGKIHTASKKRKQLRDAKEKERKERKESINLKLQSAWKDEVDRREQIYRKAEEDNPGDLEMKRLNSKILEDHKKYCVPKKQSPTRQSENICQECRDDFEEKFSLE